MIRELFSGEDGCDGTNDRSIVRAEKWLSWSSSQRTALSPVWTQDMSVGNVIHGRRSDRIVLDSL
jgi:hypothetical protein